MTDERSRSPRVRASKTAAIEAVKQLDVAGLAAILDARKRERRFLAALGS